MPVKIRITCDSPQHQPAARGLKSSPTQSRPLKTEVMRLATFTSAVTSPIPAPIVQSDLRMVGACKKQHAFHHARHAFILFRIEGQRLIVFNGVHLRQRDLRLHHEVVNGSTEIVGQIGGELGQPLQIRHAVKIFPSTA